MPSEWRVLTDDILQETMDTYHRAGSLRRGAKEIGLPYSTFVSRMQAARMKKITPRALHAPIKKRFTFPLSNNSTQEPVEVMGNLKVFVISDIHIPYHDIQALEIALGDAADWGADVILLNGDIMDFVSLSRFERLPLERDLSGEIDKGREFLSLLRDNFPAARIVYREGNHESRLLSYLCRTAPEFQGLSELTLPSLLRFLPYGIEYVDRLTRLHVGDLTVSHGDGFARSAENVARIVELRAQENVMIGHFHRSQEYIHRTARGSVRGAWSIGCLCSLTPRWLPENQWNHGYARVHLEADGGFEVQNRKIIKRKIY